MRPVLAFQRYTPGMASFLKDRIKKNMKQKYLLVLTILSLFACGQNKQPQTQVKRDSMKAMAESQDHIRKSTVSFITDAAIITEEEINAGKSALKKARNLRTKQYAQKAVQGHMQFYSALQTLASETGVTLPTPDVHKGVEVLNGDFDKAYIKQSITNHKKLLEKINTASASEEDSISVLSMRVLPVMEACLSDANIVLQDFRKQMNNRDISHN